MEDSSRLLLCAAGILAVGLLIAQRVCGAAGQTLRGTAGRLDALREATQRRDPRDRAAVDRLAAPVLQARRSVTSLPLGSPHQGRPRTRITTGSVDDDIVAGEVKEDGEWGQATTSSRRPACR